MRLTITLSREQWRALDKLARLGILAADLLGPDDPQWDVSERETHDAHEALKLVNEHATDKVLKRPHKPAERIECEPFNCAQASAEGWAIDLNELTAEWGVLSIRSKAFGTHRHALAFVTGRAALGSAYHLAALDWIAKANALHEASQQVRSRVELQMREAAE